MGSETLTEEQLLNSLSDYEALVLTLIGEARGEPIEGQIAIANVIKNRAHSRNHTIKDTCLAAKQFSCWNIGDPNRAILLELANKFIMNGNITDANFHQIEWVASGVISGVINDNVKNNQFYTTTKLFDSNPPTWVKKAKNIITLGHQTFFSV